MIFSERMRGASRLLVTLTATLLMTLSSTAAATTLKIATLAPDGTSWMKMMRQGAAEISQRTDGRVKLKFYPGGVMGNTGSVLQKMRIGQLQGGAFTGSDLSTAVSRCPAVQHAAGVSLL